MQHRATVGAGTQALVERECIRTSPSPIPASAKHRRVVSISDRGAEKLNTKKTPRRRENDVKFGMLSSL